jgi:hypothetical protein
VRIDLLCSLNRVRRPPQRCVDRVATPVGHFPESVAAAATRRCRRHSDQQT